jgi:DNA primase
MPFVCPNGSGFTTRDITGFAKQKYLNAGGTNRRALFYGWREDQIGADMVLCEGPFDVLRLHEHGIPALGLLGKTLSSGQFSLLTKLPVDSVVTIMLDPEADVECLNIAKLLNTRFDEVYVAQLPDSVDPGDSTFDQAWAALNDSEKVGNSRLRISGKKLFHVKRRFNQLNV